MAEPSLFWPYGLPQSPSRSSYTRATGNNTIRTTMEFGPAKTRRRSSAQPSILTATYLLRGAQKELFLQFYEIVDCHASFWLPNPEDLSQYILVKIRASGDDQGATLSLLAPGVWSVPLTLEVHPHVPAKTRA